MTRFLCICNHGNCRSFAMSRILKYSGHEAIPIGRYFTSIESIKELVKWSHNTLILTDYFTELHIIPDSKRIYVTGMEKDRWGNPFKEELNEMLMDWVEQHLEITPNREEIRKAYPYATTDFRKVYPE